MIGEAIQEDVLRALVSQHAVRLRGFSVEL